MSTSEFMFMCCQFGAETALKLEIERLRPTLRFAFSKPGFVTFKNGAAAPIPEQLELGSVFARTYGFSLGKVDGGEDASSGDVSSMSRVACQIASGSQYQQLHVWPRDTAEPGHRGFAPGPTEASSEIGEMVRNEAIAAGLIAEKTRLNGIAKTGHTVLDIIIVDENLWWVGKHIASSRTLRQPGGMFKVTLPEHAVSRAYVKMNEAVAWSQLPIESGDRIVEIGSAPGGASQALLEKGLLVTGIDPSDMNEAVKNQPNFVHVKKRGSDLKRKEYEPFQWLTIDTNVAPGHTLDTVESIVTHDATDFRGMLITLKLPEWNLVSEVPNYLARIRSWGFGDVRARQLANNRQEICVAVLKNKADRRLTRAKRKHLAIKNKRKIKKPATPEQGT